MRVAVSAKRSGNDPAMTNVECRVWPPSWIKSAGKSLHQNILLFVPVS